MSLPKVTIISFSLLAVTTTLTLYFLFKTRQLNTELKSKEEQIKVMENENIFRQPLIVESIDSLLLLGKYERAIQAYKTQLDQSDDPEFTRALELRFALAHQLMKKNRAEVKTEDTLSVSTPIVSTELEPVKLKQIDSLNFALDKAYIQVKYLERQLKENKNGAYLTFNTSKGKKAHYVGQVKNKMANGKGVALLSTGSRYEGEWKDNLRHGEGTFYWPDGQHYIGSYANDRRQGKGAYYWPNGEKFVGDWKNDHRNGQGIFYGSDGKVVASGIWKNDELVKVDKK
ncbi:MAG: MORN repeat-containing protein [Fulvivirga sp.]